MSFSPQNSSSTRPVFVLGANRIPFVRSFTHYQKFSTQDLMTAALQGLVKSCRLEGKILGDVALGAVMKSSQDWNLARECSLGSGLHPRTPATDVIRACGTSLEAAWTLANKITLGQMSSAVAGGVDTNSDIPVLFPKSFADKLLNLNKAASTAQKLKALLQFGISDFKPQFPGVVEPRTGKSMGDHCEMMVKEFRISREDQDRLAVQSHKSAAAAFEAGFYKGLISEFSGLSKDGFVRADTSFEKLSQLKPAFDKTSGKGTLTAGNSTPLSDGAACVLLGNEDFARENNLQPWARWVDAEVAAFDFVRGEGLLMAPTLAVARLLKRQNMQLQDFDFYEIHEAFAGQVLCTLKAWESADFCKTSLGLEKALGPVDRSKMNLKGGSLALGHPFAATGARILGTLAKTLYDSRTGGAHLSGSSPSVSSSLQGASAGSSYGKPKRGLISICTGGGMGVAAILESI